MEESCRIFKLEGEAEEDFHLWMARTEAALEDKNVWHVVKDDVVGNATDAAPLSDEEKKNVAKARAVIMQGLGDNPLRLCLQEKDNPCKMWKLLNERYAVENVATKVQLQYQLSRLAYGNQVMTSYIDKFQNIFNRLAGIGSPVDDETKVATLLASFGDKSKSPYGQLVTALQASESGVSWNTATARLIQEYNEKSWVMATPTEKQSDGNTTALNAGLRKKFGSTRRDHPRKWKKRTEKRRCFQCNEIGHIARNCPKRTPGHDSLGNHSNDGTANHATMMLAVVDDETAVRDMHGKVQPSCSSCASHSARNCVRKLVRNKNSRCSTAQSLMVLASDEFVNADKLLLDSGASGHMVRRRDLFIRLRDIAPQSIILGDGASVMARKAGDIQVKVILHDQRGRPGIIRTIVIRDVLYVPGLATNLISFSQLCSNGYDIKFKGRRGRAMLNGLIEFQCRMVDGVCVINCPEEAAVTESAFAARDTTLSLWHDRLGHANVDSIRELERRNAVIGLDLNSQRRRSNDCRDCSHGKQHKKTMAKKKSNVARRGEVIHGDVSGKMTVRSIGGSNYYVTFIDEYSRYITVVPIARKSDVLEQFKKFHVWFERNFDCRIKKLHCDDGGEYVACDGYLTEHGIEREHIPPYSPEMNGLAERMNRTLVESVRAMLFHAKMPMTFWAEGVVHAADIRNRLICPRSDSKTSYELLTGIKPRVDHLRVFGSLAFAFVPKEKRKKLDAKSEESVIVGCIENGLYKVWIPTKKRAALSKHIKILENKFPPAGWHGVSDGSLFIENEVATDANGKATVMPSVRNVPTPRTTLQNDQGVSPPLQTPANVSPQHHDTVNEMLTHYPAVPSTHGQDVTTGDVDEEDDSVLNQVTDGEINQESRHANSRMTNEGRYPQRNRKQPDYFQPSTNFLAAVDSEPNTVQEAMSTGDAENWRDAIQSELQSLDQHSVWHIEKLPAGTKPLRSRFVFRKKMLSDGTVGRFKARLVVKGFMQGNVEHTFAPVVDFTTIRVALALAVQHGFHVHQMDVRTAFLHGEIDDAVYILPPEGSEITVPPGHALRLRKGPYGLKQAPRLWYEKWLKVVGEVGGQELLADNRVFKFGDTWIMLYVDDLIIIGPCLESIEEVKRKFSIHLDMKDLGELSSFLGVDFVKDEDGAWLTQCHNVDEMLKRFGMDKCKSVTTPACQTTKIVSMNNKGTDEHQYRTMVGALLFLSSRTRPDIAVAVNLLARKCSAPTIDDHTALKRVLRYLQGTRKFALRLTKEPGQLIGYSDADWGGDLQDRKSTSGALLKIGKSAVYWKSAKQKCVSLSTSEAEFVALSHTCQHVMWLRFMLKELGHKVEGPTTVFEDNRGALVWGTEGVRNAKHVSIRENYVKDLVAKNEVELKYCATELMSADILTKPLQRLRFEQLRTDLGVSELTDGYTSKRES